MKTILLLLLLNAFTMADEVTTIDQHVAFFSDIAKAEQLGGAAVGIKQRYEQLERSKLQGIQKDEFETTAQFEKRKADRDAALDRERQEIHDVAMKIQSESEQALARVKKRQESHPDLTTRLKVKMGRYDADSQTVESFAPELSILGKRDERLACVATNLPLPTFKCTPDDARRLREASDKGELFCIAVFTNSTLELSRGTVSLPTTRGEKFGEALAKFGLGIIVNAVDPSKVQGIDTQLAETKTQDANTIQIQESSSIRYINFLNNKGTVLVK